jgi:hypothetical protein
MPGPSLKTKLHPAFQILLRISYNVYNTSYNTKTLDAYEIYYIKYE